MILSVSSDGDDLREAIREGASGYILKGVNSIDLIQSVEVLVPGGPVISPARSLELISSISRQGRAKEISQLTDKEREILDLVATDKSNREIRPLLDINERQSNIASIVRIKS